MLAEAEGETRDAMVEKILIALETIAAAVGTAICAILGPILASLKGVGKTVVTGHKTTGPKIATPQPGITGEIVFFFLFKTSGQVIGYLAEYNWLLIIAAVALMTEVYIKRER